MNGIAVITNGAQWAISNMADYSTINERDGKNFKRRQDLKLISIFGHIMSGDEVEGLFKPDSGKGVMIGFKGNVRAVVDKTVYVNVIKIMENTQEIFNKIGGIKNG